MNTDGGESKAKDNEWRTNALGGVESTSWELRE